MASTVPESIKLKIYAYIIMTLTLSLVWIVITAASVCAKDNLMIHLDMHPSTPYIQWLNQQIIDQIDNDNISEEKVPHSRGLLRRNHRRLIEEHLQLAMEHMRGTSAAYAPFLELPIMDVIIPSDNEDDQRRLKQSLQQYNNAVQEYNERFRHYSRYERALRQERRTILSATSYANSISSLNGTKWQATDVLVLGKSTNTSQLQPPLINNPITLEFDTNKITGSTGCNRYFGPYTITSEHSFNTSSFATTRKLCPLEGVMEQEQSYTSLMSNKHFLVEVVNATDSNSGVEELVLWDYIVANNVSQSHERIRGVLLARFLPLSNSIDQSKNLQRSRTLQETTTRKKGGLFNSYQTSPLHQGYGTHYATIWVGTPPQRKSVIIDTGSHFTAFPCKGCLGCGEEHHTDKYFDQDASSTFRALTCKAKRDGPKECQGSSDCVGGKCILSQTYTEGSSWEAFQAVDKLFVGGKQLTSALDSRSSAYGKTRYWLLSVLCWHITICVLIYCNLYSIAKSLTLSLAARRKKLVFLSPSLRMGLWGCLLILQHSHRSCMIKVKLSITCSHFVLEENYTSVNRALRLED